VAYSPACPIQIGDQRFDPRDENPLARGKRTSRTEKATGRCRSPSLICAEWILPKMLAVPTPCAIPANRVSTKRIMLQRQGVLQYRATHPHCSAQEGETANVSNGGRSLTNRCLCARVYKCFHFVTIDLNIDVEHADVAKCFGLMLVCLVTMRTYGIFYSMSHIFQHGLLSNGFLDLLLGLQSEL
jgi:hypothetical protein